MTLVRHTEKDVFKIDEYTIIGLEVLLRYGFVVGAFVKLVSSSADEHWCSSCTLVRDSSNFLLLEQSNVEIGSPDWQVTTLVSPGGGGSRNRR